MKYILITRDGEDFSYPKDGEPYKTFSSLDKVKSYLTKTYGGGVDVALLKSLHKADSFTIGVVSKDRRYIVKSLFGFKETAAKTIVGKDGSPVEKSDYAYFVTTDYENQPEVDADKYMEELHQKLDNEEFMIFANPQELRIAIGHLLLEDEHTNIESLTEESVLKFSANDSLFYINAINISGGKDG